MQKFINRLIPGLTAIVVFGLMEQLLNKPRQIIIIAFLIIAVCWLGTWQLTDRKFFNKKLWQLVITPATLLVGGILFFSFLENPQLQQIFLVFFAGALWTYFEVVYLWLHFRPKYQPHSLENISTDLNLVTIFLTASGLYGLMVFFGLPLWELTMLFIITAELLTHQMVWASGATLSTQWPYVSIITLAVSQVFVAVSYLPSSMYVNGILVTLSYYFMSGIARNWLLDIKDTKVIRRYLLLALIAAGVVLLSAKWFS